MAWWLRRQIFNPEILGSGPAVPSMINIVWWHHEGHLDKIASMHSKVSLHTFGRLCGLQGCKNRPALFPDQMS